MVLGIALDTFSGIIIIFFLASFALLCFKNLLAFILRRLLFTA